MSPQDIWKEFIEISRMPRHERHPALDDLTEKFITKLAAGEIEHPKACAVVLKEVMDTTAKKRKSVEWWNLCLHSA